jgi:zinc protease
VPDVKRLGAKDLSAFHAAHWLPAEAALVVVGDHDLAAVRPLAEQAFGTWKGVAPPRPPPTAIPAAPERTEVVLVDRPDSVQSALFYAQPFPKRSDPGHEARVLLSGLLGGLFTSRLNQNLREKHAYTYGARSDLVAARGFGALVISTRVEAGVTVPALREVMKELGLARDPARGAPVTEAEVARARADATSSLAAHLLEVDRVADDLGSSFVQGLDPATPSRLPRLYRAVTTANVSREATRIDEARAVVVVVGDAKTTHPELESAGFVVRRAGPELTW